MKIKRKQISILCYTHLYLNLYFLAYFKPKEYHQYLLNINRHRVFYNRDKRPNIHKDIFNPDNRLLHSRQFDYPEETIISNGNNQFHYMRKKFEIGDRSSGNVRFPS